MIVVGTVTGVLVLLALAGFCAWWYVLRRKRAAQNILQQADPVIDIVAFGPPPAGRSKEKVPFPSAPSPASSPTTSAAPTMERHRAPTFSSSTTSQPLVLSVASPDDAHPGAGSIQIIHVHGPHPAVLGLRLGSQGMSSAPTPTTTTTTAPLSSPTSALGDMDVPPPAYSPPQSRD